MQRIMEKFLPEALRSWKCLSFGWKKGLDEFMENESICAYWSWWARCSLQLWCCQAQGLESTSGLKSPAWLPLTLPTAQDPTAAPAGCQVLPSKTTQRWSLASTYPGALTWAKPSLALTNPYPYPQGYPQLGLGLPWLPGCPGPCLGPWDQPWLQSPTLTRRGEEPWQALPEIGLIV